MAAVSFWWLKVYKPFFVSENHRYTGRYFVSSRFLVGGGVDREVNLNYDVIRVAKRAELNEVRRDRRKDIYKWFVDFKE